MSASLVGSEMCIRDRASLAAGDDEMGAWAGRVLPESGGLEAEAQQLPQRRPLEPGGLSLIHISEPTRLALI
eukprot:12637800-Alexandrium_andersonii.AAC.1